MIIRWRIKSRDCSIEQLMVCWQNDIAQICQNGLLRCCLVEEHAPQRSVPHNAAFWGVFYNRSSAVDVRALMSRRIPARYAALCIPGYGRVPSLCDERVQTGGCVFYNRSSAVVVNASMSRGRRANPVLTYETALRRFFPHCAVDAIRWRL